MTSETLADVDLVITSYGALLLSLRTASAPSDIRSSMGFLSWQSC
jgi:hypothetical protein